MTLHEFLDSIRRGEILVETGGPDESGAFVSSMEPLALGDAEAVTAEAFNRGIFSQEDMPWDDALATVEANLRDGDGD